MATSGRRFQLVLWGATGFTGKLVAEYLAQHAPSNFRWAIAGRSKDRLEVVLRSLPPSSADIIIADIENVPSLEAMTSSTDVLLTTAGPFLKHGVPVAQACATTGTHYIDSTGESAFVQQLIPLHERLQQAGVLFVPMCGFDCIPTDVGTLLLADHCTKLGTKIKSVKAILAEFKGGVSGGTLASLSHSLDSVPMSRLSNPLLLVPANSTTMHRFDKWSKRPWPVWSSDFNCWTVPSIMAGVNEQTARRSASLASPSYGASFCYSERAKQKNLLFAVIFSSFLFGALLALYFRLTRSVLMRLLPKPGEGPSRKERDTGYFVMQLMAETEDGRKVHAQVRGIKDPGYGETSKMLAESAMCLCLNKDRLPAKGGLLTPSTAFGNVLIERLRAAGMTFEIKQ